MPHAIGQPLTRIDGRLKVTGRARYTTDHRIPNTAHAVLVMSAIAKGRIASIDTRAAGRVTGVLAVVTHENASRLATPPDAETGNPSTRKLQVLQDDVVRYPNQPIGVVVAESLEAAREAAALLVVQYAAEPHDVRLEPRLGQAYTPRHAARADQPPESARGDVARGLAAADVRHEHVYRTPLETHNPMEPHATIAVWDGPTRLALHDATQGIFGARKRIAALFGLRPEDVRVISEFLGGGFGSKGPTWSHVVLAAMAARHVGRPVKLALARPQMFGPIGWRSPTRQAIAVGARRDGTLTALRHETVALTSSFDEFMEPASMPSRMLYSCPDVVTSHRLVRADIGTPSYMRAPGWAPGTYALECAIDEMAHALEIDPLAFRLKNHADRDPEKNRRWSTKALRECYEVGAEQFGWKARPLIPGTLRDGHVRIGWGMATAVYPAHRSPASARVRLEPDGLLIVETGSQDLGTGTYTILAQIAAEAMRLPATRVRVRIGDTELPETPVSGGSQTAASVGTAVHLASTALRQKLIQLAVGDGRSPLSGLAVTDVALENGRLVARAAPSRNETLQALLARVGMGVDARADAELDPAHERYASYAFGAEFAEVRVDGDLGQIRVSRLLGVFDPGRVLNAKTARSQFAGGMVWGMGIALHEDTVLDERLGRVVNGNLADYHVPVHADVPAIEVQWVERPDEHVSAIGAKGIGELPITGAAAAIANAVFHATGRRVRDVPITPDKLL